MATIYSLCDKNDIPTMVKLFEETVGEIEEESINAAIVLQRMLPQSLKAQQNIDGITIIDGFLSWMVEAYAHDEVMTKERLVGAFVCWYVENELGN